MDLADKISAADEYAARVLSDKRYGHTRRVAQTARKLAKVHGVDPDRAYLAGLLHDIARELGKGELLRLAGEWDIPVGEPERRQPTLLHAPVAAELALRELSVKDEEVLDALRTHTTTAPGMSPLALVLYLADKVEPGRKYPEAELLREVARGPNLYEAARITLRDQIQHTRSKGKELHPASRAALEWLDSLEPGTS
jgi:predicted HD superfamily hydrolase involved in NAD metabolism